MLLLPKWIQSAQNNAQHSAGSRPSAVVRVMEVEPTALNERLRLTGSLMADESVRLRGETSGIITGIFFDDGSRVAAGQLLVKIRDDELQAQRRARMLDIELARIQAERQERLLRSESTTQEAFDEARIRLETMKADLALIDARIAKTEVRAPFDGLIGLRQVSMGAFLETSTVIASLQAIDSIKMDIPIPERFLPRIRVGMEISFRIDGFDEIFSGTIKAIDPRIQESTRTLVCRAIIDNREGKLLPGGFATIDFALNRLNNAIMVPSTAILPDLEVTTVFVVEGDRAVSRQVQTGIRTRDRIQIIEGLSAGEVLIVAGLQGLRDGSPVTVMEPVQ